MTSCGRPQKSNRNVACLVWFERKGRATKGAAYALKSRVELYDKRYEDVIKSCAEVYKLGYELVDGTTPEKYRSIGGLPIKITRKLFSMYNTKARTYTTT